MIYVNENSRILNWPEFPLVRVAILLILGIFVGSYMSISLYYQLGFTLLLFVLINVIQYSGSTRMMTIRLNSFLILILIFSVGVIRYSLQCTKYDNYHYTKYIDHSDYIVGQVIQEIKKKKASSSTLLSVQSVNGQPCRGKLLVYFNKRDSLLNYTLGDIIAVNGRATPIQGMKNPRAFDYKKYLANKGIDRQIFLKEDQHSLISQERLFFVFHFANEARNWALDILDHRLPDRDEFATASAMVLGNREHISEELKTAFSDTGAVHVLAVSGLHVGIVIMFFNFLFRRTRSESKHSKKVIKFIILTLVVIAYALITGASPAVVRASIMFSTLLLGRLWFDNTNVYNILAFSAILILLYDPNNLTDLGFIFSYLALISIVFFQPRLMRWIEQYYEPTHWLSIRILQLITVSIAAQILIFPMSISLFHKFPLYFILSGVFAVAMAPFILGFGLVLIMISWIPFISETIAVLLSLIIKVFLGIIYGIQMLPFNSVDNVWISKFSMICLYLAILAIMHLLAHKKTEYELFLNPSKMARNVAFSVTVLSIIGLFINSIYATYRIKTHNEMIIYDVNKTTLIDIYNGTKLNSIILDSASSAQLNYACRDNRIFHGNHLPEILNLESSITRNNFIYRKGLMRFLEKNIYFLINAEIANSIPTHSDILLISHSCQIPPYSILNQHTTQKVVMDGSISYKMINQWKKECLKRNIPIHITKQDGAYILKSA